MANIIPKVPIAKNEPILSYSSGSKEKKEVLEQYKALFENPVEIKMRIGDKDVKTGDTSFMCPHTIINTNWAFIIKRIKKILKLQLIVL